jgi:uncharacterized membrane protein
MSEQEPNPGPQANPYRAPESFKPESQPSAGPGDRLIADGRRVPGGNGTLWIARAWDLFKEAPGMWILLTIIYFVLAIIVHIIPAGSFLFYLLSPILLAGLMIGCESLANDDELELPHLFAGFSRSPGSLLLVGLLYLVGTAAVFIFVALVFVLLAGGSTLGLLMKAGDIADLPDLLATGGLVLSFLLATLLFLALLVPLLMAYWFAPALVVFHRLEPLEAMKMSFIGCMKNWIPFLLWGLLGLVLAIIATIPAMLGWLVVWPIFVASIYTSYRDIFVGDLDRIGAPKVPATV